jgi:hypothetical protein
MKANNVAAASRGSVVPRALRAQPRLAVSLPLVIERGTASFRATAVDLGLGGMFIEPASELRYGERIDVLVQLTAAEEVTRLPGVVRWINQSGFGIQFLQLGARATYALGALLATLRQMQGVGD